MNTIVASLGITYIAMGWIEDRAADSLDGPEAVARRTMAYLMYTLGLLYLLYALSSAH